MPSASAWGKMFVSGAILCIGGPALVYWVMPSEEELFKRYNPELQKRSLEGRKERQEEFDQFVTRLKEYSKSDKPIWEAAAEADAQRRRTARDKQIESRQRSLDEAEARRQEVRLSAQK